MQVTNHLSRLKFRFPLWLRKTDPDPQNGQFPDIGASRFSPGLVLSPFGAYRWTRTLLSTSIVQLMVASDPHLAAAALKPATPA